MGRWFHKVLSTPTVFHGFFDFNSQCDWIEALMEVNNTIRIFPDGKDTLFPVLQESNNFTLGLQIYAGHGPVPQ